MNSAPFTLSSEIKRLSAELKHLERRLQAESAPDPAALAEFRHAVDGVRLAAWTVSELVNTRRETDPDTVFEFLAMERLRRFDQLVGSIRGDIERRVITFKTAGITKLFHSVNLLHEVLDQCLKEHQARH
jgi:hypothetical protein